VAAARALLEDRDTFATVLFILALDTFGPECLHDPDDPDRGPWHATTFNSMIEQHFGVKLPKCNLDKIMAACTIVTTDLFFKNVDRFIVLANVLAGDEFDPSTFEPADSVECAWAITEALLLDPPDADDPEPFGDDVRRYIGFVLRDEGYITPPDVLKIAIGNDLASKVRYDFADDPEMFSGIYATQQEKTQEVESTLRACLLDLREQLTALHLRDGTTAEVIKRLGVLLKINEPEAPAPDTAII
jgi:hypothetical protein